MRTDEATINAMLINIRGVYMRGSFVTVVFWANVSATDAHTKWRPTKLM